MGTTISRHDDSDLRQRRGALRRPRPRHKLLRPSGSHQLHHRMNTTRFFPEGDINRWRTRTSTAQGSLVAAASANVQGMPRRRRLTGAASGSALTLASNSLTVAANTGVGTQTISKGQANARIGSLLLRVFSRRVTIRTSRCKPVRRKSIPELE